VSIFAYQAGELYCEKVALSRIAQELGTPCYVYSSACILECLQSFRNAFRAYPHKIYYAVKANSNLSLLALLKEHGCGFEVVSGGELQRVLKIGADPNNILFSGIGKTATELELAIKAGIKALHIESFSELQHVYALAKKLGCTAAISLRINPAVEVHSHPYISTGGPKNKFGIPLEEAIAAYRFAKEKPELKILGIACHIGSQINETRPFVQALEKLLELIKILNAEEIPLSYIDLGGGLGIKYSPNEIAPPTHAAYAKAILPLLEGSLLTLAIEPGRALIAQAGALLAKVTYIKQTPEKSFAILDTGMNDLLRPALYQAFHPILALQESAHSEKIELVGPVCESADSFGDHDLNLTAGNIVAILNTGAYGFSMASNYNSRPRPCEVLVDGDSFRIIRKRETIEDLWKLEL
jgi:diaminopimelate decarboxylase